MWRSLHQEVVCGNTFVTIGSAGAFVELGRPLPIAQGYLGRPLKVDRFNSAIPGLIFQRTACRVKRAFSKSNEVRRPNKLPTQLPTQKCTLGT